MWSKEKTLKSSRHPPCLFPETNFSVLSADSQNYTLCCSLLIFKFGALTVEKEELTLLSALPIPLVSRACPAATWTLFWSHRCYWQLTPLSWVWVFFLSCPGVAVYLHSCWLHVSVCSGCSSPGPLQLGDSPPEALTSASLQLTSRRSLSRLLRLR